jgi:hypothetical protein
MTTIRLTTAEWTCTKCQATNRKLVPAGTRETVDRCVTCHERHVITQAERPVRWEARAAR